MGAMKRISIELVNLGYDMTTTTLRDVLKPAPNETPALRLRRPRRRPRPRRGAVRIGGNWSRNRLTITR